ncbi:MAG: hypothetical protein KIT61_08465 [Pyrinomonadaceae bacterium]|jgi:hypothetical protein|nr:hypothetical protein [Blastocatellia bacterium]MCW5956605.1 hypothetical protein [Pyrinomonadaceae bacterium]
MNDSISKSSVIKSLEKRACAVPSKCHTPRSRTFDEMMASHWEEIVIRYDKQKKDYVTLTACCPGAPVCC